MMSDQAAAVLLRCDDAVATLTLNRPDKLNPLDGDTIAALGAMVEELDGLADIRVVRLTGAGKAFSADDDLAGYISLYRAPDVFRDFLESFHALLNRI